MAVRKIKKTTLRLEFGKIVRTWRVSLSFSQEKLAELSNLNANYVGCVERGERNISIETIYKIAHGLRTNPKNLLPEIKLEGIWESQEAENEKD